MRLVALVLAASLGTAYADPPPATGSATPIEPIIEDATVHAGVQVAPPIHAAEPSLNQDLDQRRSIRGCNPSESCGKPKEVLHAFELEAFPKPGQNPWLDERAAPSSHLESTPAKRVRRPSELRPDQPWLDKLEMPDLPVVWSQRLVDYLMFYKDDPRGHSIMKSWLEAQGRYRELIVSHLRAAHLPEDLLYDAMIESSYDPDDTSYAGALGLWQFMHDNGHIYGLRIDHWVDERKDPLRSTIAMMDYWQDLHERFGDWQIALAAFNAGYGAVLHSIARYNTNDFYKLCDYENGLPWETCLYTPKVIAAAIVGHNRAAFGYDAIKESAPETFEEVSVPASVSFAVIARAANANEADIKRLNPQLKNGRTPPGEIGYAVRVPIGAKADFAKKLADLQSDWSGYDAYVLAHGERLEDVATTFGMSLSQLKKLNGVDHEADLDGGTLLVVPRISEADRAKNKAKAKAKLLGSGVDAKDGEQLIVALPDKAAAVPNRTRVFYRVVAGDVVAGVASALAVDPDDLLTWNGLDDAGKLHPKMVLVAWVKPGFDAAKHHVSLLDEADLVIVTRGSQEHLDLAEQRAGRVRTSYVASGKEKLADVAKRFGMGSHDLARINQISYDTTLEPGQTIVVYEVTDPSRSKRADEQFHKTPRARRGKAKTHDADAAPVAPATGPVTKPE
ncbi:MAG TPA: LysM peptidoglycan-binding domain-containing protein [Kofleriaceae bacterium]|nr:LysM peptidoglycan-binding domain-containing protein [Kofleriaceae bacterium]